MQPTRFPGKPTLRNAVINPPSASVTLVDEQARQAVDIAKAHGRAEAIARKETLIHLSNDTVVDISNYIRNPVDLGGATLPTTVVSYQVPTMLVLLINKIGVTYSNPMVSMSQCVGWRIVVNGNRVPNIVSTADDYSYSNFGSVHAPLEIEPLWVQAGQLVAVEVYPRFGFNSKLTVTARLSGRLYKPAVPELVR